MNLPSIIPPSDLLKQVEGVEAGLRKLRRLGSLGHWGFWLSVVFEIVTWVLAHPPPSAPAWWKTQVEPRAQAWMWIASIIGIVFLAVWTWSKFWLQQSRQPFRYTCHVGDFTALGADPTSLPKWRVWLPHDLARLLSERIGRLQFLNAAPSAASSDGDKEGQREHIEISGVFGVRKPELGGSAAIEVLPSVRIGGATDAWTLAHRVVFAPQEPKALADGVEEGRNDYIQLLERVYFSVASELYRKIAEDVKHKIALIPTKWLRALALFHEAEDYAQSSTLLAHEEAGRLYRLSAETLDPSLRELPRRELARTWARIGRRWAAWRNTLLRFFVVIFPSFSERAILCARALTGSANMGLYQRLLATMSGLKPNAIFQARREAADAVEKLEHAEREPVTADVCHATFDARVALAFANSLLGSPIKARTQLERARALSPARAELNPRFLVAAGWIKPEPHMRSQLWQRALEIEPRFEAAHYLVGYVFEDLWRSRVVFERAPAEQFVLSTYRRLSLANPSILGTWGAIGYIRWLLGEETDVDEARRAFETGRQYKEIKQTSFVADLDLGLMRICAEAGEFEAAYGHYAQATAAIIAHAESHGGDPSGYHFRLIGPALLARFERYRKNVEKHLANPERLVRLTPRAIQALYSFVLADYAEACSQFFLGTGDGRYRDIAVLAVDLALVLNPHSATAHYQRLRNLGWLGELDEAQKASFTLSRDRLETLAPTWIRAQELLGAIDAEEISNWVRRQKDLPDEIEEAEAGLQELRHQDFRADGPAASPSEPVSADLAQRNLAPAASWRTASKLVRTKRANELRNARRDIRRLKVELRSLPAKIGAGRALILRRTRQRVPHRELWVETANSLNFNWPLLERDEVSGGICWERDLDDLHVGALQGYASTLGGSTESDRKHCRLLFDTISAHFWPDNATLLDQYETAFPESQNRPDHHAAWCAMISDLLDELPGHWNSLNWATNKLLGSASPDSPPKDEAQVLESHRTFVEVAEVAVDRPHLSAATAFQLVPALEMIAATAAGATDSARRLPERASIAASRAADLSLRSDDPALLCDIARGFLEKGNLYRATSALAQLRSLEDFSPVPPADHDAARTAAKTLGKDLLARRTHGLLKIADALKPVPPPPRRARELSAQLGGRWLLRGQVDRARSEFDFLATNAARDDYWRTIFSEQLEDAAPAALTTMREWLKNERRPLDCPAAERDALAADLTLIRSREKIARGSSPAPPLLNVERIVLELDNNFFPSEPDPVEDPFFKAISRMRLDIERDLGVRIPRVLARGNGQPGQGREWRLLVDEDPILAGQASDADWIPRIFEPVEKELRKRAALFFGIQEFSDFLKTWKTTGDAAEAARRAKLAEDAVGDPAALRRCAQVLAGLLRESVSIADLDTILTAFRDLAPHSAEPAEETETLRFSLRKKLRGNADGLELFKLGTALEEDVASAISPGPKSALAVEPHVVERFVAAVRAAIGGDMEATIITERPGIRRHVRRIIEFGSPNVHVLSAAEVMPATAERTPVLIDYPETP
jgi:hypothetical protein